MAADNAGSGDKVPYRHDKRAMQPFTLCLRAGIVALRAIDMKICTPLDGYSPLQIELTELFLTLSCGKWNYRPEEPRKCNGIESLIK